MAQLARTPMITYNVHDRGRKVLGQDRRFDLPKLAALINGPEVQEKIKAGDMLGYLGHWPRVKFGMATQEGAILDGQTVSLPIAVRTVHLSCDDAGNITHQTEFLDTDAGREAKALYDSKAGGFSSAIIPMKGTFPYEPKSFSGMDFVLEPNYNSNRGYRGLLDSVLLDGIIPDADMQDEWTEILDEVARASAKEVERMQGLLDSANTQVETVTAELANAKTDLEAANAKAALLDAAQADLAAANEKAGLLDSVQTALDATKEPLALLDSVQAQLAAANETIARLGAENDLLVGKIAAASNSEASAVLDSVRHETGIAPGRGGATMKDFKRFKGATLSPLQEEKKSGGDAQRAEDIYLARR